VGSTPAGRATFRWNKYVKRRIFLSSMTSLAGAAALWPLRAWSQACRPTSPDVLGPFYIADAPRTARLAGPDEPGDALTVTGRVLAPDCQSPLTGALLELWQADAEGRYYEEDTYRLRGQLLTDDKGTFTFNTIVPGRYRLGGSYRPAHIHLMLGHPRHQPLTTQLYFKGDPYLGGRDACGDECDADDPDRILDLKKAGRGFTSHVRLVLRARA
jgi:catechol 1,2-dioxygenase